MRSSGPSSSPRPVPGPWPRPEPPDDTSRSDMARLLAVMTTTAPVDPVIAAVNALIGRVGPGLYGVACSGGADSMALADAAICAAGAAHVVVLVIDHGLTPAAADAAHAVAAWARAQDAAAVIRRVAVARRSSLEAAARDARYAALAALADEL